MTVTGSIREVAEGRQFVGADEVVTFTMTTTNVGSAPSSVSMVVKEMPSGVDVTSTVTSGSTSVAGDIITLKPISGLTPNKLYRVEVLFTAGGFSPAEHYIEIECEL